MRNDTADISVLIPTYNCGQFINHAIESAMNQTLSPREILVIDDGSTDNTPEVVKPYTRDKRLRYVRKKNAGQAHTRKYGVELSKCSYIGFLDADDLWEPQKVEKQMEVLQSPENHICFSEVVGFDDYGNTIQFDHVRGQTLRRGKVLEYLFVNNFVPHSSLVVEKEYLKRVGSFDENLRMGDDWDIVLRLSTCCSFDFVPEKLVRYRIRRGQLSKDFYMRITYQDKIIKKFIKEYPHLITPQLIRQGNAYRARTRGYHYASVYAPKAFEYYAKAIRNEPLNPLNYKGAIRTTFLLLLRKLQGSRFFLEPHQYNP